MYQCFVICPFGDEHGGAKEARLFSQLRGLQEHVFKVAEARCLEKGFDVRIRDARKIDHGRRRVLTATQQCIDEADAVLVILTADKPNVFLELGWAQGMWQDPILLWHKGYERPADINNDLVVPFTDAQASGADQVGANDLAEELAALIVERIEARRTKPFDHWPETTLARGAVNVYNRFLRAITPKEWSRMIRSAEREIIVASTQMSQFLGRSDFESGEGAQDRRIPLDRLLLTKALDGVKVTILMYHEDNVTLGHLKRLQNDLPRARKELKSSFAAWSTQRLNYETLSRQSGNTSGGFRIVQIRKRHLPFRVTLTERRAIATLRFYTESYNSGLCIDAICPDIERDPYNLPVYWQIKDELDFLIAENMDASENEYVNWTKRQARG